MTPKSAPIRVEDEAAFAGRVAVGMTLGRHENGNLRIVATLASGERVHFEAPKAWVEGPGGLRAFLEGDDDE